MKNVVASCSAVLLVSVLLAGCPAREKHVGGDAATETIAPAAAKPDTTGTDAMTQTVDIEDSRSEAEGSGITNEPTVKGTAPTATGTAPKTTTAAPSTTAN